MPPRIPARASCLSASIFRHLSARQTFSPVVSHIPNTTTPTLAQPCLSHHFSQTSTLQKKGGKQAKEQARAAASESGAEADDVSDFSELSAGIEKALQRLTADLSKLRTGGRFNPELIENLRVQLVKDSKSSFRLGELAQVLPKGGRAVMVIVGEKDHVKAITSAIQASPTLNLQPQPDAQNPSQLNVPIPPPTKESRDAALQAATKAGDKASAMIRDARAASQKRLRAMELKKTARPDDLKKAGKEMEKLVERGGADVKKLVDGAKKTMEQS